MGVFEDLTDKLNSIGTPAFDLIERYWWLLILIPLGIGLYLVLKYFGVMK